MSAFTQRRYRRVRVADVPYSVRIQAARQAVAVEPCPRVRDRIQELAHYPGDLIAYIAA